MSIIPIIQFTAAILLVAAILLQSRGTGLGTAFGGEGNIYRTKRGLEKSLFKATVALAVVFLGAALANTLAKRGGNPLPNITPEVTDVAASPTPTTAPDPSPTPTP